MLEEYPVRKNTRLLNHFIMYLIICQIIIDNIATFSWWEDSDTRDSFSFPYLLANNKKYLLKNDRNKLHNKSNVLESS